VAGHQRTKALRRMGASTAPVYVLPTETTTYDEIRFNQLHNGTDLDGGDEDCRIDGALVEGYQTVDPTRLTGNMRARLGPVRREIAELIRKYGPWGGVVATISGKIIHCGQYALAAIMTHTPLTVYAIPDEREAEYRFFLDKKYGVFSYDGLKRDTYIQTFAQMMRLRDGPTAKENRSILYETFVLPWLKTNAKARGLDFGSGQGDYAKRLRSLGYEHRDVELFRRARGQNAIDMRAVNRMIDGMVASLEQHGGFDFTVCDAVMNSVDSLDAEDAVLTMLNALTKSGGDLFISGRKLERVEQEQRHTQAAANHRYVEFLDEHGFSALYRKGRWFYQKFHDGPQMERLLAEHGFEIVDHNRKQSTTAFQIHARKTGAMSLDKVLWACEFEFNLHVSATRRIGRHEDVKNVMRKIHP
uniref:methyltransferase domain-containing protein n=1 Tax=uncultured Hyphomicrobium sp. TaxID=194373 RepID=UPI0025D946EA